MKFNGNTPTVFSTFATVGVADNIVGQFGWSSKNIIDKLCPAFTESGNVVTCTPVEGYPLEVVSAIAVSSDEVTELKLTHGSKNFANLNTGLTVELNGAQGIIEDDGTIFINGTVTANIAFTAGKYAFDGECIVSIQAISGSLNNCYVTTKDKYNNSVSSHINPQIDGSATEVPVNVVVRAGTYTNTQLQVMIHPASTDSTYKPYKPAQTYTVPLDGLEFDEESNAVYDWKHGIFSDSWGDMYWYNATTQQWEYLGLEGDVDVSGYKGQHDILALPGVNTLFSNTGNTTVTGRKDLIKVVEDLTNAIVAMGDNV